MDPISTAIIAAVTAGVIKGAGEAGQRVLVDAYKNLRNRISQAFGERSDLVHAIEIFEDRPESTARREVVVEEVARSGAERDQDLLAAARDLLARLEDIPEGRSSVQQAVGNHIAQADRGSHAEVHVNTRDGSLP